ncbi:fimbrial protein [Photobacterium leiognathi]|uniref:fimbrial protein n=1 Tax=Photobacterium leiognathi TaxID=553611 RepID=UPI002980BBD8|nr:fimbrial protein [Photobacterium leiognathi]
MFKWLFVLLLSTPVLASEAVFTKVINITSTVVSSTCYINVVGGIAGGNNTINFGEYNQDTGNGSSKVKHFSINTWESEQKITPCSAFDAGKGFVEVTFGDNSNTNSQLDKDGVITTQTVNGKIIKSPIRIVVKPTDTGENQLVSNSEGKISSEHKKIQYHRMFAQKGKFNFTAQAIKLNDKNVVPGEYNGTLTVNFKYN